MEAYERIIFPLDTSSWEEAELWCHKLYGKVGLMKIGLQLFTEHGPNVLQVTDRFGFDVMLDLKLHDIPNTVGAAAKNLSEQNWVKLITVHASGGAEMIKAACDGFGSEGIAAVTVLTSLAHSECETIYGKLPYLAASHLAQDAVKAGVGNIVCSGHEVKELHEIFPDVRFIVPGVRRIRGENHDQKRVTTPREAIANGAEFLVIGRPIRGASNPEKECELIADDINRGLESR